jgi:Na+-transporting methylmalonyl-CoA/oxaloacetate decarboxylase beta subunit
VQAFYVVCAVFGGGILLVQLGLALAGFSHGGVGDAHADHLDHQGIDTHAHASEGMHLRSARALAAGLTFFGLGGLLGLQLGLGPILSAPIALILGAAAQFGTAAALRTMSRFEQDRTVQLDRAIGQPAIVYLAVPAAGTGLGKVHVSVQERLIECPAVSRHEAIPTGSSVLVVDVDDERPGTLVVVPSPPLLEASNAVV